MIYHWSLSDSKSPQVSRTLLSILVDVIDTLVWMVSAHSLISKSSTPRTNLSVTVSRAPVTICIIVTFKFHVFLFFFQFPCKVQVLIYLFACFKFYFAVGRGSKVYNSACSLSYFFFFLLLIILVIRLYLKLPQEFVRLIFHDRF